MRERSNQEWIAALKGAGQEQALTDLRSLLVRGLRYAMADRPGVAEADLEDFAQGALMKILAGLDSFRGRVASPPGPTRSPSAWPSPNCAASDGRMSPSRT
ncbi:MAG TPA: hypothetical protein EYH30_04740 [Anaerolineales bacterium]|nr:hypothetical protein [Anaerolineae bacterium]HIQ01422.1 hypothetical protein [Anaerolineales bacterium]